MPRDLFEEHGVDLLEEPSDHQSLLKSLAQGYGNYYKGALRGMGQAFGDAGASAINWPISGIEHLTGRQLPHVPHPHLLNENPGSLAESIGQTLGEVTGGFGIPGGAGIKAAQLANKGYKALRAGKETPLIAKLLAGGAGGALEGAAGNEQDRRMGAILGTGLGAGGVGAERAISALGKKYRNASNLKNLEKSRDVAQITADEQAGLLDALQRKYSGESHGITTPEGFTRAINKHTEQIAELEPQTQIPHEPTKNLLNYPTGEELVPNALKEKEAALLEHKHYLGSTEAKGVEFAREFHNSVKKAKHYIQKTTYEPVEEYTKKTHLSFPRQEDVNLLDKQLEKFYNNKLTVGEPAFQKARDAWMKQHAHHIKHDLVSAHDFIQNWKETKSAAVKAGRLGFQEGGENQQYWQNEAERLKNIANEQLGVLEKHLPKEHFDKLKLGNKLWAENIGPLYGNKIYESSKPVKNKGKIDVKDILHEVRGEEPGQAKVRQIIQANPKLGKLALGHTFAENPEALLNAHPYYQQFVENLPSLQGMQNRLRAANRAIPIAEAQHAHLQANRKRTEIGHEELVKQQFSRQQAIQKTEKLNKEVSSFESKRKELQKQFDNKEITKEEFERLDKKHKESIKDKKSLLNKLKKGITYGAAVMGISDVIKHLL